MYISSDAIIKAATVLTALLTIGGFAWGIIRWILKQNKIQKEIKALRGTHDADIKVIQDELCVLSYAVLATLDGLKQLGANGNVTKAHEKLEKHLNQQAHDQI